MEYQIYKISAAITKRAAVPSSVRFTLGRRYKSGPYGYTQAKSLYFSKNGEPTDVLKYEANYNTR